MNFRLAFAVVLVGCIKLQAATGAEIHGTGTDARDGHAIQGAVVGLDDGNKQAECNSRGGFAIANLIPGNHLVQISAPGYRAIVRQVDVSDVRQQELIVHLVPKEFDRVDSISITAAGSLHSSGGDQRGLALSAADVENLGTVLADDPLRAVQALPGVTSNDDFEARFSLRGEDFSRIGVYLDGVLLHDAVHSLEGTDLSGSASLFDAALVGGMDLYEDNRPAALSDTSGAALEVHMRDGDHDRYSYQLTANVASAGFSAGGPLGRIDKCSWVSGFRKSFIQYLLAKTLTDPSMAFGITDGEGRVSCAVNPKNSVSLDLVDSFTDLNRTALRRTLGANTLMLVGQQATATNLSWIYAPDAKSVVTSHVAWMDDKFSAQNPAYEPLGHGSYGEWVGNSNATRMLSDGDSLSVGGSFRTMHDGGFEETYDTVRQIQLLNRYSGSDSLASGYVENTWSAVRNRLRFTTGGRWERDSTDRVSTFSPQAGMALNLTGSLQVQAGLGQYVQYPAISLLGSNLGAKTLLPTRSLQASVALEQRLPSHTSVRIEMYNRQDRDLPYQPYADPRVIGRAVFVPPVNPFYQNSLRGYGRGVEISMQRRMSRGITGWVAYSYGRSRMRDGVTRDTFMSDYDQQHTINAYTSYLVRPSVNLSARWTYGSGFPVPGYLTAVGPLSGEDFFLTEARNTLRIGPYQRLDVRMNKTWSHETRRTTLYAEVTNLTNKTNYRFGSLDGYNRSSRFAFVTVDQMFPILPSVGVVFGW